MIDWNVWGPPIAVLLISMLIGGVVAFRLKSAPREKDSDKEDLVAKKEQIMESIRELEADKSKLDPLVYERQRDLLIQKASGVLQSLEEGSPENQTTGSEALSGGHLWGYLVGSLVFFALLGFLLQEYARPREEGQVMTGGQGSGSSNLMLQIKEAREKRVKEATETLEETPTNIDALNVLTYDALLYQDMDQAMKYMETVRQLNPSEPIFLVNLAILQMGVGMYERAAVGFEQALAQAPDSPRGLLWQALLFAQMKKTDEAIANLEKIGDRLELLEEQSFATQLLDDLQKPPPVLSGVITAEGSPQKGLLFIIARRSEVAQGPPVAVKRITSPRFPMGFELGKGDMMMGGVWPDEVWLEARLDMDGNAMTKSEEDWTSQKLGPLKVNSTDLTLNLTGTEEQTAPSEGTIQEDSALAKLSGVIQATGAPSGTLFIIARRSELAKGPPAAVQKIVNPTFPVSFGLSEKNMMMGGAWPDEVWLEARLDMDGNAMTKSEEDWTSQKIGPLKAGATEVSMQLQAQ